VATEPASLHVEIELLEKIAAEVDRRRRPGDDRLLHALESLIADKRARLDGEES
jgi:hypothetical protein